MTLAGIVAIAVCGVHDSAASFAPGACDSCTSGVNPALITTAADGSYDGKSLCQVFVAPESLLVDFAVWATPGSGGRATGMHLYIAEVDSTGRPDPTRVVLDGPILTLADFVNVPTAVHFHFSPPFALPHRGAFAAAIKAEDGYCISGLGFEVDTTRSYPCGQMWRIHPRVDCSGLGVVAELLSTADMVFQVQFVCSGSSAVVPASWGSVKARYR